MPFLSFYESACLKNIWCVCHRLCKIASAGMRWKREEPYKYSQTFSITPGAKEKLVKKLKKLLQLQSSPRLYTVSLIKRSHFYLSFACHVLYSHKPFVRPLRKQFIKILTTLCRSMYSMWFWLFEKAKYILEVFLFTFWESSSGAQQASLFYTPPVSGNILAPLHGFNGHDREYALKVNTTSVRNWTC